jgi:TetR/AcrR family transcriptional repressor of nem operon
MTKGEMTRRAIVEKAAALLNRRGFSGFSMSALMEAGLEKGGIYRHFDSKEQLAAKAFEYAGQAERSRTGRVLCCGRAASGDLRASTSP